MTPFYQSLVELKLFELDADLLQQMETHNQSTEALLKEKIDDAEANLGETEVAETLKANADHYAIIGDKVILSLSLSLAQVLNMGLGKSSGCLSSGVGKNTISGYQVGHLFHHFADCFFLFRH